VPADVAAGGAGRGDCDAVPGTDLVGVASTVISAVLPAWGKPTWIRWPPIMIAPRTDTRRLTINGSGSRGGPADLGRAPRSRARAWPGTGQATVRATVPPDRM